MKKKLKEAQELLNSMIIDPRVKIVPDQITGRKYALCLMETDAEDENRIQRHISDYYSIEVLLAFIKGLYTGITNPYV